MKPFYSLNLQTTIFMFILQFISLPIQGKLSFIDIMPNKIHYFSHLQKCKSLLTQGKLSLAYMVKGRGSQSSCQALAKCQQSALALYSMRGKETKLASTVRCLCSLDSFYLMILLPLAQWMVCIGLWFTWCFAVYLSCHHVTPAE